MSNVTATTDPALASWVPVESGSDFPIQNLPYGVFEREGGAHIGVAIGDRILDLHAMASTELLDETCGREILAASELNPLLAAGPKVWHALRSRISSLLRAGGDPGLRDAQNDNLFVLQRDARMMMPAHIGDYVDFYSSIEHATNLGKLWRPDGEALLPNWRWLPVGYHGRAGTVVVDGTPVKRPNGQRKAPEAATPTFGPTQSLDIELEVGFFTGPPNRLGDPIAVGDARDHIFGLVLVNDWSARDIQAWEYVPLGPFLGKSFATTISSWVVTLEALEPFRVAGPVQDPEPLEYLADSGEQNCDIALTVELQTSEMRKSNTPPAVISRSNYKYMYWNMAQQLAHATVNGAVANAGDLFASGTISGPTPDSYGSLIELTWRGTKPLQLPDGETRTFLQDGDEIAIHGRCEREGAVPIGFGACTGRIIA